MAYIRASQGSGGEIAEVRTLWSNDDITSAFQAQLVYLNDIITNYRYLKFKFNGSIDIVVKRTDFEQTDENGKQVAAGKSQSPTGVVRRVYYVDRTSVRFTPCYYLNVASGTANTQLIPTAIIGCN